MRRTTLKTDDLAFLYQMGEETSVGLNQWDVQTRAMIDDPEADDVPGGSVVWSMDFDETLVADSGRDVRSIFHLLRPYDRLLWQSGRNSARQRPLQVVARGGLGGDFNGDWQQPESGWKVEGSHGGEYHIARSERGTVRPYQRTKTGSSSCGNVKALCIVDTPWRYDNRFGNIDAGSLVYHEPLKGSVWPVLGQVQESPNKYGQLPIKKAWVGFHHGERPTYTVTSDEIFCSAMSGDIDV